MIDHFRESVVLLWPAPHQCEDHDESRLLTKLTLKHFKKGPPWSNIVNIEVYYLPACIKMITCFGLGPKLSCSQR